MSKEWYITKIIKSINEYIPIYSEDLLKSLNLNKMTLKQLQAVSFLTTVIELNADEL